MKFETSEIELAVKIGAVRNNDHSMNINHAEIKTLLSCIDVNIYRNPTNSTCLSKHLRSITTHGGDISLIRFIEENHKDRILLSNFLMGLFYLYPLSSFEHAILPYLNNITGSELTQFDIFIYAKNLYDNVKDK